MKNGITITAPSGENAKSACSRISSEWFNDCHHYVEIRVWPDGYV
jgi:hypothetical protein